MKVDELMERSELDGAKNFRAIVERIEKLLSDAQWSSALKSNIVICSRGIAVLISCAALPQGPAVAQEAGPWTKYGEERGVQAVFPWGNEGPEYQWESETGYHWIFARDVQRNGNSVSAWIREKFKSPLVDGTSRLLTRLTFDCDGRYQYSAQSSYREDGSVVQEINRTDDWIYVRPDTSFDVFQSALCGANR